MVVIGVVLGVELLKVLFCVVVRLRFELLGYCRRFEGVVW